MNSNAPTQTKPSQMSLWYDTPLAKSIPNRTLTRDEMFIVVCVQQAIQNTINSDSSLNMIDIDTSLIAKVRQKRPRDIRKQCLKAVGTLSDNFYTQKIIDYYDGELATVGAMAMYTAIKQDQQGVIHIKPNPDYVDYYRKFIQSSPDLQIPSSFYLHSKSQYSYNLANWLIASIYEIRRNTNDFKLSYDVQSSEEDLRKVVPPISKSMNKANYRNKVLMAAIKDINQNEFSPISIQNFESVHAPNNKRDVIGYLFHIEIFPTEDQPIFIASPKTEAIDENDTPPWDIVDSYMKKLGVDNSFRSYVHEYAGGRERAFKTYLRVIVQPENRHTGAYFHKCFEHVTFQSIYELCLRLKSVRPDLVDDYIAGVIKKHQLQEYNNLLAQEKRDKPIKLSPDDIKEPWLRDAYIKGLESRKKQDKQ